MKYDELAKAMKDHDWHHEMSDDNAVACAGMMERYRIAQALARVSPMERAFLIGQYCPKSELERLQEQVNREIGYVGDEEREGA